jgi:hypothetical protein
MFGTKQTSVVKTSSVKLFHLNALNLSFIASDLSWYIGLVDLSLKGLYVVSFMLI